MSTNRRLQTQKGATKSKKHVVFNVYSIFLRLVYDMRGPTDFLLKPVAANASMLKRTQEKKSKNVFTCDSESQSMSLFFFIFPVLGLLKK